jgi:activator of 2-hydroxyglutaryl-CoA dehydratase
MSYSFAICDNVNPVSRKKIFEMTYQLNTMYRESMSRTVIGYGRNQISRYYNGVPQVHRGVNIIGKR